MQRTARLLGRAAEMSVIDGIGAALRRGMSGALVVRGEPGVGKTALLDYAASMSPGSEIARLSGVESEGRLAYAGLHRVLVPYLGRAKRLAPARRAILESALGITDGPPANPFLLGLAVLTLLAEVARRRPLLCLVDDAQWLDQESREVLTFVARRLHADRIGMIFGVREPPRDPRFEGIAELTVPNLAPGSAADLLVTRSGGRVDRQIADHLARQAGGNPLALVEVARELAAGRVAPGLLLDEPLPLGERLELHFRSQIRALPDATRAFLLLVAAHPVVDRTVVWRAAAPDGIAAAAATPATDARLVKTAPDLHFRHPLIRSAAYGSAEAGERRHAHELLARVTDPVTQPDVRVWHRAAAAGGPDEELAAELERCARLAKRRGGLLAESAFLTRAAELTPQAPVRAVRYLDAAQAAETGGAPLRAEALLDEGAPLFQEPLVQVRAQRLQARALASSGRSRAGIAVTLLSAARRSAPLDLDLTREILLEVVLWVFQTGRYLTGPTPREIGREILDLGGFTGTGPAAGPGASTAGDLLLEGLATFLSRDHATAAPLLRRALEGMRGGEALDGGVPPWLLNGVFAASILWDDRGRDEWLTRCEVTARRTGALRPLVLTLLGKSLQEAAWGDVPASERCSTDGRQIAQALGWSPTQLLTLSNPNILGWQGRDEEARLAADSLFAAAAELEAGDIGRYASMLLIVLHLGRGDYADAFSAARRLQAEAVPGFDNEALPALIEAGRRLGRLAEATAALEELRRRATASATPWALGLLARSEALLAADPEAEPHYRNAIDLLSGTRAVGDAARAHLLYGEWLRRRRRRNEARAQLTQAFTTFADLGADVFAHRAQTEPAAMGVARPPGAHAPTVTLTPREDQIARLAAQGATNDEIAARLYLSVHTVEYHLGKVFRKLGIRSRRRIAAALEGENSPSGARTAVPSSPQS
ncbi:helix-turn-helix transcriptional regulator [Parafrankia discariae]|uniref:helix-turn-helix transcriptional regulator n=1 Tax=Parafrankia discariae TaxID=365528 RepID=UPI00039C2F37|nr:LuxR family transcriptional regulator [Parafrankia discariae]